MPLMSYGLLVGKAVNFTPTPPHATASHLLCYTTIKEMSVNKSVVSYSIVHIL